MLIEKNIPTSSRCEIRDITNEIKKEVEKSSVKSGICTVFVPHTTCGITINENGDPDVKKDILKWMEGTVPRNYGFSHFEGNSDSHIKTILTGNSVSVIVENGRLVLGTWQGIYFCEFDGPRNRKYFCKIIEG